MPWCYCSGDRVRICNVTLGKLQSGLSLSTNTSSTIEVQEIWKFSILDYLHLNYWLHCVLNIWIIRMCSKNQFHSVLIMISDRFQFLPTTAYSDVSSSFVYLPNDPSSYGQDDYVITGERNVFHDAACICLSVSGIVATNTYPSCANQKDCQFKRVTLSDNGVLYCEICKSNFADSGLFRLRILFNSN